MGQLGVKTCYLPSRGGCYFPCLGFVLLQEKLHLVIRVELLSSRGASAQDSAKGNYLTAVANADNAEFSGGGRITLHATACRSCCNSRSNGPPGEIETNFIGNTTQIPQDPGYYYCSSVPRDYLHRGEGAIADNWERHPLRHFQE